MKNLVLAIAVVAALCASPRAADATLVGQKILSSGQIQFGSILSKTLYITGDSPYYLVDSGAVPARVALDTAVNSVGAAGASSATIPIQTVQAVSQQSNCELSYKIRGTDPSQASVLFTAYGRYRTPWVDTDTAWTAQAYLWAQDTVLLTHAPPGVTTSFTTRRWYFMPSGDDLRINIKRANVGAGDTVAVRAEIRCR